MQSQILRATAIVITKQAPSMARTVVLSNILDCSWWGCYGAKHSGSMGFGRLLISTYDKNIHGWGTRKVHSYLDMQVILILYISSIYFYLSYRRGKGGKTLWLQHDMKQSSCLISGNSLQDARPMHSSIYRIIRTI